MEERELTIEDIEVWPCSFQLWNNTSTLEGLITFTKCYQIGYTADIYIEGIITKQTIINYMNESVIDTKMFFDAVKKEQFDNEMKDIINEA